MEENTNVKRLLTKYQVKSLVIGLEDENIFLDPTNIMSIEYLNDYDFNLMALLKINIRIDIRKKLWILRNKREAIVKFELDKLGIDVDMEHFVTSAEEVWNLEFGLYLNDEEEAIDVDLLEERLVANEGGDFQSDSIEMENYFESQNLLDLYLFNPALLKASRKSFNRIYTETTLQNIVGEMLTSTKHENVLMSKFENDETYKELLIPVNPVYKCLVYLDQYYGFYEKGSLIYYDIDTLYILNSNGKVTAKREDEWEETTFIVSPPDTSTPGNGMMRVMDEDIFYPMLSDSDINPQKFSIGKNVDFGSDSKIVVTDDVEVENYEADHSYVDQRNEKVIFIRGENKYVGTVYKARLEENECVMYIGAQNVDITAFTPNKTFRVVFQDPSKQEKYGENEYRLAYAYHFIRMESELFMNSSHRFVLKRTDGPSQDDSE